MRTNGIGRHVWLALVLTILAAALSTKGNADQLFAIWSAESSEEVYELAGSIGDEFPLLGVPP